LFVTLYGAGALPLATGVGPLTIETLPPTSVINVRFADSPKAELVAAVVTQTVGVGVGVAVGVFVGVFVNAITGPPGTSSKPASTTALWSPSRGRGVPSKEAFREGALAAVFAGEVTASSRPRVNARWVAPIASSAIAPSPSETRRTAAERNGRLRISFEILCAAAVTGR
jgi:hypothetical protein